MEFLQHRSTLVSGGLICSLMILLMFAQRAFVVKQVTCFADARFAPTSYALLQQNILSLVKKCMPAQKIYEHIHALVPSVQAVKVYYRANHQACIHIQAYKPYLHIYQNGQSAGVLTDQAVYISPKFFTSSSIIYLPQVVYASERGLIEQDTIFLATMAHVAKIIIEQYNVTWFSQYHIQLIPKDTTQKYRVHTEYKQIAHTNELARLLKYIRQIYQEKMANKSKKWQHGLDADIRIRDRIIVKPEKK